MFCAFLTAVFVVYTEHLNPVNVRIAELREAMESVTAEQQYLKARDARHRRSEFWSKLHSLTSIYEIDFCIQF